MKNAKRLAALFLTAAVLLTAGCSRKTVTSQNSVWFIAKSTNTEFWKSAFAGANAAKSEYNVDLTICGPETEEDYEEQNRLIDEAVRHAVDRRKDHHHDGRQRHAQQAAVAEVAGKCAVHS